MLRGVLIAPREQSRSLGLPSSAERTIQEEARLPRVREVSVPFFREFGGAIAMRCLLNCSEGVWFNSRATMRNAMGVFPGVSHKREKNIGPKARGSRRLMSRRTYVTRR